MDDMELRLAEEASRLQERDANSVEIASLKAALAAAEREIGGLRESVEELNVVVKLCGDERAAAERERDAAIDWVAGLLVEAGATRSQVDTMRDHVRTKILGTKDKP
jgi:chromosome segregation ATPase